jgi:hypothetical protein
VFVATAPAVAVLLCEITSLPGLLIRMMITMFWTLFWVALATAVAACCVADPSDGTSPELTGGAIDPSVVAPGCPPEPVVSEEPLPAAGATFAASAATSGSPADEPETESGPPA